MSCVRTGEFRLTESEKHSFTRSVIFLEVVQDYKLKIKPKLNSNLLNSGPLDGPILLEIDFLNVIKSAQNYQRLII